ncbi:DUF2189 domain-containing protein [Candidatus Thioglobus sp.]|jgi:uncharacterized membrane protein|uniref:DUF2189 domain-containing protein n=1 Tax=Candidatus Thioglobus sp. TaxID=2026721 RepID=UPI001E18F985|nr:DUF2189 domain-containing protein [Candidatus Thioglobus sp.]MBT3276475.1 DUF2189 domain-containing protein [Candidatus Thioglobus sp.]MBT3446823.1 DUF2189 domain-containing protein [Candidatus Thioglobus sp.]MBT4000536.1 DUF2189 domain-containing protein [Candidatus Thioglobus sp.]MBT4181662.1 DUF2189 domain-containing protein [Candidatus Thioglobus sp.]MBT4422301.1 DUF2189 domain-containing protein [Candidatus Thioglobus sp.]
MALVQTVRMQKNTGKKATINRIGLGSPVIWISKAFTDIMTCPKLAVFYGGLFTLVVYNLWTFLAQSSSLHDVAVPLVAMIILVLGPISAISLYDVSRKISNGEKPTISNVLGASIKSNGSCPSIFLSIVLMLVAVAWMVFSPLIYTVFTAGALNIVNTDQSIIQNIMADFANGTNMGFVIAYSVFTLSLALVTFMISWFAFPMVHDQDVDPFTAISTSLSATSKNALVMIPWIVFVGAAVTAGLLTPYFSGLIIIIPVLAHATWHAYEEMIGSID